MKNPLIEQFGKERRWVNYRLLKFKGKLTKIPYSTNGLKASSTDRETWATYAEAKEASDKVGIVFTPAQDLLGIDIDHCINKVTRNIEHEQKDTIENIVKECDSYTEISPSGEGIHILIKVDGALALSANRHAPYEAYTSGRYFTVTSDPFGDVKEVRTVSPADAVKLLGIIGYPWKHTEDVWEGKIEAPRRSPEKTGLADEAIIRRAFRSKNGRKIKALFDGNMTDHDNDASACDMALLSHLAFWTKDATQLERIWMSSPLGSREKTADRKDYRDRTISNAILLCKGQYETPAMKVDRENPDMDLLFILGREGTKILVQNTENMYRVLMRHPTFEGRLRYDIFKNVIEIRTAASDRWRNIEENDAINIQTSISVLFPPFSKVGKEMIYDAMVKAAKECSIDSASDWLKSLRWDGVSRLDSWLHHVYGVPLDKYHKAVGSNTLKGLVKRITEPGCKFDNVLVLEGPQGSRKSTSLSVLGGEWHTETTMSTDNKDFFMQMSGKAIIEFSEGETLSRTEVKRMKGIITTQVDRYRPSYGRLTQDFPRRCIFTMTTNQDEYLKDETGNRRWLPVRLVLPKANIEWLKENREQLYAEAYHRIVRLKETIYEFPEQETIAAQDARRVSDPNADLIAHWYFVELKASDRKEGITIHQVYKGVLHGGFPAKPLDRLNEMTIGDTFRRILGLERKQVMRKGFRTMLWFPKDDAKKIPELDDSERAEMVIDALSKF